MSFLCFLIPQSRVRVFSLSLEMDRPVSISIVHCTTFLCFLLFLPLFIYFLKHYIVPSISQYFFRSYSTLNVISTVCSIVRTFSSTSPIQKQHCVGVYDRIQRIYQHNNTDLTEKRILENNITPKALFTLGLVKEPEQKLCKCIKVKPLWILLRKNLALSRGHSYS